MTISRVQGNARGTSTTETVTVTLANTPVNGNLLVAVIGAWSVPVRTVSSISQTGVTWSKQVSKSYGAVNDEIWVGVVGEGASTTITITLSGFAAGGAVANVCEYSGVATSSFLDDTATNSGNSVSPDTGTTALTSEAVELWIGGTVVDGAYAQSTPRNGFALLDGAAYTSMSAAYLEKVVSSTAPANSGTTISTARNWAGCIVTLKCASPTLTVKVTATADDGFRGKDHFGISKIFHSDLNEDMIGRDYDVQEGSYDWWFDAFFRFAQVNVPAGATITSAVFKFTANETRSAATVKWKILGDKEANPTAVSSYDDYTNRAKTTANVLDNNVPAWTTGRTYSYDITSIIAELIAQGGWAANNAIQVFVMENGSSIGVDVSRYAKDYQLSSSSCAELDIAYAVAAGPAARMMVQVM